MFRLQQIINEVHRDRDVCDMVIRQATEILVALGIHHDLANNYLRNLVKREISDLAKEEKFTRRDIDGLFVAEDITDLIKPLSMADILSLKMADRAERWFSKISPHLLPEGSLLDLGGGSGEVAKRMLLPNRPVSIADALDWRKGEAKTLPYLPVINNEVVHPPFDQVVVITAFHHSDDPDALVAEAFRLAKKRVIFIESVTNSRFMYLYGSWIDWFYNHIVHYSEKIEDKIHVPCLFKPATGWEQLVWRLTGLSPTVSKDLGIFQSLNPEWHHLFVYDIR